MKKAILVIILATTTIYGISQGAGIKGNIKKATDGSEVFHVLVSLNNQAHTFTDANGNFNFNNIAVGDHVVSFSLLGFEKISKTIKISSPDEQVEVSGIQLKPSAIQINEVVVSSSPLNYSSRYEGSNVIVSSKEIELRKPIGTEEVLKNVSGVNVSGDMGISNRLNVGIRGSYPRRSANILLLEDGSPIAPAPYLAPEAYYNPPSDRLDGIEVLKGADILTYGSNTMYGAINYITKKPPVKPTLGIHLTGGENGYRSGYLTYGGTWDKVGAEVQLLNKEFGGFQDNSSSKIFNTTAKLYSELNSASSIYLKLNYHQERSNATYSALTPYTFKLDPRQNPFDADILTTTRYAVDLAYNQKLSDRAVLSSKVYLSEFQRDWWRQENTLIKASTANAYLGEEIYADRYSYLNGQSAGPDDYIRVGKIAGGAESARARNRLFKVAGAQETFKYNVEKGKFSMNAEAAVKGHWEQFNNMEIKNDSSRFAQSGTIDKDQLFQLAAYSGLIKSRVGYDRIVITPSLRYEWVQVYGFDKLAISRMTHNDGSKYFGSQRNEYSSIVPGASVSYDLVKNETDRFSIYAGIYRGYTAPIADYAFMNVEDGVVSAPSPDKPINRQPEISLNHEAGFRGELLKQMANIQASYFNNHISHFYSAGRNEAFQTLGAVNIYGAEGSAALHLHKLMKSEQHRITLNLSGTYMKGKVLSGVLKDSDLLKAKHTSQTKAELLGKINADRNGYDVYFSSVSGKDSLIARQLNDADFAKIKRIDLEFGESGISNNTIPYLPPYILNAAVSYGYRGISFCAAINYVAAQYTDYLNFENETAEGAIGRLDAFKTIDLNLAYAFEKSKNKYLNGLSVFVAGKNITNEVYKASRLHRVSSGIMPCGFRQVNAGIRLVI